MCRIVVSKPENVLLGSDCAAQKLVMSFWIINGGSKYLEVTIFFFFFFCCVGKTCSASFSTKLSICTMKKGELMYEIFHTHYCTVISGVL